MTTEQLEELLQSVAPSDLGVPDTWLPLIENGITIMTQGAGTPDQIRSYPYDVDFVWDQAIHFTFFGAPDYYRALYIVRPRFGSYVFSHDVANLHVPFVVGVRPGAPGYTVRKMASLTWQKPSNNQPLAGEPSRAGSPLAVYLADQLPQDASYLSDEMRDAAGEYGEVHGNYVLVTDTESRELLGVPEDHQLWVSPFSLKAGPFTGESLIIIRSADKGLCVMATRELDPGRDGEVFAKLSIALREAFERSTARDGRQVYFNGPDGVAVAEAGLDDTTLVLIEARELAAWERYRGSLSDVCLGGGGFPMPAISEAESRAVVDAGTNDLTTRVFSFDTIRHPTFIAGLPLVHLDANGGVRLHMIVRPQGWTTRIRGNYGPRFIVRFSDSENRELATWTSDNLHFDCGGEITFISSGSVDPAVYQRAAHASLSSTRFRARRC